MSDAPKIPGWTADQWIAWLHRKHGDPVPSWRGLNDCADTLAEELTKLRALADRVAALNPDAGEIGAGMLASLVAQARKLSTGEP